MTPVTPRFPALFPMASSHMLLDMAKRAGRVGSIGSLVKTGHFKTGQSGCGSNGLRVESGCKSGQVDPYFSKIFFFFFEVDAICQLFMSSLTIIRFLLVILLPITTKHLT